MSLEGTRFEKLQNSIKNEVKRKRNAFINKDVATTTTTTTEKNNLKKQKVNTANYHSTKDSNNKDIKAPADGVYNNDNTIYIQGLPFTCTEEEIHELFSRAGEIASVRLPRWNDSGKLRGYGHIVYQRPESATKALELNGEYIQDRYVIVDRPKTPRILSNTTEDSSVKNVADPPVGCKTIFVKNLPYDSTEEEIRNHFMVYGPIVNIRVAVWNHTGKQKGFCDIEYKRTDSAITAVKKSNSITIRGRITVVDFETGAPKGSFKGSTNKKK